MSQIIEHETTTNPKKIEVSKISLSTKLEMVAYVIVAIAAWFYAITKLFMIDFDVYLLKSIDPSIVWVLDYKFFALVVFLSLSFILFGKGRVIFSILFISFFPIIAPFFVAYHIFKSRNWMALVAIVNALVAAFSNFRLRFILFSLTVVSLACIYSSLNEHLLAASAVILFLLNVVEYGLAILSAFKTSRVTEFYRRIPEWGMKMIKLHAESESVQGLVVAEMNKAQLSNYRNALQSSLIANKACLFSATILREYKRSGFPTISGAVSVLALFTFTVITFAAINYAVLAIDIDAFTTEKGVFRNLFTFFHYSFNTMVFSSIKELTPATDLAYAVEITQRIFFLFLSIVFVSLLVTTQRQKFTDELDEAISHIKRSGSEMESYIYSQFGVATWEDALNEIRKMEASMVELLLFFTRNINV